MSSLNTLIQDLVIANRILAKEDVVDAYGHVSVRHPENPSRFLIARSVSPELVGAEDIVDNFGDTNLLVTDMAQGRDLAKCLGGNNVALMRGHGFAAASRSLIEVVRMSVYLPRNARVLMRAKQLGGEIKYLLAGEIEARNRGYRPYSPETWRAWEYWANRAGCGHLLTRPES